MTDVETEARMIAALLGVEIKELRAGIGNPLVWFKLTYPCGDYHHYFPHEWPKALVALKKLRPLQLPP